MAGLLPLEEAYRRLLARAHLTHGEDQAVPAVLGRVLVEPRIIAAVRAGVTLGEISIAFRGVWGVYRPQ